MEVIKAVKDKMFVEMLAMAVADKTEGGIIIPESAQAMQKPQKYGKVISVGEEIETVKVGDLITFPARAGMDVIVEGKICKVLAYPEIFGTVEGVDYE